MSFIVRNYFVLRYRIENHTAINTNSTRTVCGTKNVLLHIKKAAPEYHNEYLGVNISIYFLILTQCWKEIINTMIKSNLSY